MGTDDAQLLAQGAVNQAGQDRIDAQEQPFRPADRLITHPRAAQHRFDDGRDALRVDKYADEGVLPEEPRVLRNQPFDRMGTVVELMRLFGGKEGYQAAVRSLEAEIYRDAG